MKTYSNETSPDSPFLMPVTSPDDHRYLFKFPFANSIRPLIAKPDATLSLLHEINFSFPCSKRLPTEILHYINKEVHCTNTVLEDIRSTWSPATDRGDAGYSLSLPNAVTLDLKTKTTRKDPDSVGDNPSTNLMYRLRCFFPEVDSCLGGIDGYKTIWGAVLHHNPSCVRLLFSESKALAFIGYSDDYAYQGT